MKVVSVTTFYLGDWQVVHIVGVDPKYHPPGSMIWLDTLKTLYIHGPFEEEK